MSPEQLSPMDTFSASYCSPESAVIHSQSQVPLDAFGASCMEVFGAKHFLETAVMSPCLSEPRLYNADLKVDVRCRERSFRILAPGFWYVLART